MKSYAIDDLRRRLMRLSVADLHLMCSRCGVSFGAADKIRRGVTKRPQYGTVVLLDAALRRRKV